MAVKIDGSKGITLPTLSVNPSLPTTGDLMYFNGEGIKYYNGTDFVGLDRADGTSYAKAVDRSTDIPQGYPTGWYWVKFNGTPRQVWVDMDYDGGGWVLVASHTSGYGIANATYSETTNIGDYICKNAFTIGTGNPTQNTVLLPLPMWPLISQANGNSPYNVVTHVYSANGVGPSTATYRSRWTFTGWTSQFGWQGASNLANEVGGVTPNVYSSHVVPGYPWTTYDNDQDTYSSNCAQQYGNQPFWYESCWSGNWFAGGSGYSNAWYWTGSGSDYHAYGAAYVK